MNINIDYSSHYSCIVQENDSFVFCFLAYFDNFSTDNKSE